MLTEKSECEDVIQPVRPITNYVTVQTNQYVKNWFKVFNILGKLERRQDENQWDETWKIFW